MFGVVGVKVGSVFQEGKTRVNTGEGGSLVLKGLDGTPEPLVGIFLLACVRVDVSQRALCQPLHGGSSSCMLLQVEKQRDCCGLHSSFFETRSFKQYSA